MEQHPRSCVQMKVNIKVIVRKKSDSISRGHSMKRIIFLLAFVAATLSLAAAQRLPHVAEPENYKLSFTPDLEKATFEGDETISIKVLKPTSEITLNAVDIDFHDASITSGGGNPKA